jgi:hypothetical protein
LVNAFCHSASVHNGFLCGRLCSIFIPNRIPASNALIISFEGGIHFVFVRFAISASFRRYEIQPAASRITAALERLADLQSRELYEQF